MNASGKLQPQRDGREYISLKKARPFVRGHYIVDIIHIGRMRALFDGQFRFDNGDVIPESIILGWK